VEQVILKIQNVECSYDSAKVLKDINFEVKSGDFVGIIGPNGSGKTTLLRSMSRTLKPRVGTVLLDGKDVFALDAKEVAKNLAVLSQTAAEPLMFTALEVVLMGRTPHLKWLQKEGKKDYAIVKNAMRTTNSWQIADRIFTELSSGEKQRVMIARALAQTPRVLLLDEPTTHLDINNQVEILNLIKDLSKKGKLTVIAVFHDLNLAAQYCDYLILLHLGKIESIGAPAAVLMPENIKHVYKMDVLAKKHPITGLPYLIPFSSLKPQSGQGFTVHLICGGGTGAPLMSNLLSHGYRVTAGVLSTLDTDHETAGYLNVPVVTDPPFSPANEAAHKTNLMLVKQADAVVLTDMQVGWGNIKNLRAAMSALKSGIPLVMIEDTPFKQRDFTGGEAERLLNSLKREGAITVGGLTEVILAVDKLKEAKASGKKTKKISKGTRAR